MINTINTIHTITSPNIIIPILPKILIPSTVIVINISNVSNKIVNDVMKKAASKTGVEKLGWGMGSRYSDFSPNAQAKVDRAVELTKRSLKQNKGFKKAIKVDKIGTGVALTGAGLMAANHFLNKKKKEKDNE